MGIEEVMEQPVDLAAEQQVDRIKRERDWAWVEPRKIREAISANPEESTLDEVVALRARADAAMKRIEEQDRRLSKAYQDYTTLNNAAVDLSVKLNIAMAALETAAVRLEILTGRMRACHEETGKHELIGEAEAFCSEAREALGKVYNGQP